MPKRNVGTGPGEEGSIGPHSASGRSLCFQNSPRRSKLDETRAKARERMAKLRAARTPKQARVAAKKRRREDADYRELLRARKFRDRYGKDAFFGFYYPQYKLLGQKHLPGLYFGPDEQAELKRVEKEVEKMKRKKGKKSKKGENDPQAGPGGIKWLYLRNQPRANTNHCPSCLDFPMAARRPTNNEFFPDSRNFVSQKEHDESKRKMYFVVPQMGIFTRLNEALNWEEDHSQDGVLPALTMKQAVGILDSNGKPKVKKEPRVKTEPEVKTEPVELKRGGDTPSPKRPLYTDDEDEDGEDANVAPQPVNTFADQGDEARSKVVAQDDVQTPTVARGLRGKRARPSSGPSSPARVPTPARGPIRYPTAELPDISPTISSASSLSAASSMPASASASSHPLRNLGESASTARRGRGGAEGSARRVATARSSPPATRSSARRGRGSAPASARRDPTVHFGSSAAAALRGLSSGEPMKYKPAALKDLVEGRASASTSSGSAGEPVRLLWNHAQRTVYKDTGLAVQEMQAQETVQVVGLEELVEYVSGRAPAVGSSSAAR
ncbi:hypothetical protein C8R43DRAFT_961793 [Mycena crocata]|nr:hypothetical protein C8R43DRAFT_961793 [Mycena crocata]